jgi:hypothetical protein
MSGISVTTKDGVAYALHPDKVAKADPKELLKPKTEFYNSPQMILGFDVNGSTAVIESTVPKVAKVDLEA